MRTLSPLASSRQLLLVAGVLLFGIAREARAAEVYLRAKVLEPAGEKFTLATGGWRHDGKNDQWYLPTERTEAAGGAWSPWIDLTKWDLPGRSSRTGGLAEWPALKLTLASADGKAKVEGCALQVQFADKPDESAVVIDFTERSGSDTVGFLLPHPLRDHQAEFETGSQMAARHLAWAKEASGGTPPKLKHFDLITSLWGPYDPALARLDAQSLKLLGFNVLGGVGVPLLREEGLRTYTATWHLVADPTKSEETWRQGEGATIAKALATDEGKWLYGHMSHYVVADEIQVMDLRAADPARRNGWFRDDLRARGVTETELGQPVDAAEFPAKAIWEDKTLPRDADLPTRKLMYHAGKFVQRWSVQRLRQTTDLIHETFQPTGIAMRTETLPSDHGFFNAWGPPHTGMSHRLLDLFEVGERRAVDVLSVEDWMGLNYMYGPYYTWTGGQSFGYLSAIMRSGTAGRGVELRGLITPSDDPYLRLKAYSNLGQGSKSFFFWTYGPTYIGTENYWSEIRSEYDGIAKLARALEASEDVLYPAQTVRDPVAILYSVSHDLWHADDPAAFVETRLTWHALRHAGVQPDFLREEDVEAGRLQNYRVLYVAGTCLTRKAAAAIDAWARGGGVVYLSSGAATRDEYHEPALPGFAAAVWPADAAAKLITETGRRYNERGDLPSITPLTTATVSLPAAAGVAGAASRPDARPSETPFNLRVLGYRLDLRDDLPQDALRASYADGRPAAAEVPYGEGRVIGVGFLPGLAYSPFKVGQKTLDETWPAEPRRLITLPLAAAKLDSLVARPSEPVVEASLLNGPRGAAVVLANYTYRPIPKLAVNVKLDAPVSRARSTEGSEVIMEKTPGGVRLTLPLEWTDIVVLEP